MRKLKLLNFKFQVSFMHKDKFLGIIKLSLLK